MKKILFFLFAGIMISFAQGQSVERSVISSAGGTWYDGSSFELDYTLGEVAVLTISNTNNFLTQGFQQPFKNTYVAIPETETENQQDIYFYPNPVNDNLNINFTNAKEGEYKLVLYNLLGQVIKENNILNAASRSNQAAFNLTGMATGNYFVRVLFNNEEMFVSKIIKVNQ